MRTVLSLGGTGQFGLPIARFLAADPMVDRVIVAGRDLAKAQAAAATLGPKGEARQADAEDDAALAAAMEGVSVVVDSLWSAEGRAARVARAAVAAGTHYVELPGGRRRGPLGRRLAATLTADERDPATVAAVLRDACAVPAYFALIGGPARWSATVPDLRDGAIVDVDARVEGFDASVLDGSPRRERPLVANERPAQADGIRRLAVTLTGLGAAFDDAVRAAARRVADGGAVEAEIDALEERIARDPSAFLRPAAEVASLPTAAFLALGRHAGAPVRAAVAMPDALFVPERYLDVTAAAVAVTVRYLLDGTVVARGAATMADAVRDAERFGRDYLELLGPELAGHDLFTRRVVPA